MSYPVMQDLSAGDAKLMQTLSTSDMRNLSSKVSSTCAGASNPITPVDSRLAPLNGTAARVPLPYTYTTGSTINDLEGQKGLNRIASLWNEELKVESLTYQLSAFCFMSVSLPLLSDTS